jgi:uncharacterized protein YlaI
MPMLSPWLISEETGEPFRHCIHCQLPLDEIDAPWLVNKEYRGGECVLEYAICQHCRNDVAARFSEASKSAVRKFLEEEIDWAGRIEALMDEPSIDRHLAECIRCHAPREMLKGFGISAQFDASGDLLRGPLPLLMCDDCTARLRERFSPESLVVWQRFLAEHFPGPPDDSEASQDTGWTGLM